MKTKEKGLQKFTDAKTCLELLLSKPKIVWADFDEIKPAIKAEIEAMLTERLNSLKGKELDKFIEKIDSLIPQSGRNALWEKNHATITANIANGMQEAGRMPSMYELEKKTGLSRQTISKHLKEYATHPLFLEQAEQFKFMNEKVLANLFKYAINGNVKAARLFFEVTGGIRENPANNTLIKTQNNYIQINGTVLSQEAIKHLKPEQLNSIEAILKNALLI